jgi:hypothetical protein
MVLGVPSNTSCYCIPITPGLWRCLLATRGVTTVAPWGHYGGQFLEYCAGGMSTGRGLNKPPKGLPEDGTSSLCYKFMGLRCRGGGGGYNRGATVFGPNLGATAEVPGVFSPNCFSELI